LKLKQNYWLVVAITLIAVMTCGAEFQVNTRTSNKQENPAISMDAEGNFVVVWNSYLQDGSSNGIYGRCFDSNCSPVGDEFQVNTTISGNQREPSVAMDAAGNFVVVWYGPGENEEDIFARRFDPNGLPVSEEYRVNSRTESRQRFPRVAMNDAGVFAVVWESEKLGTSSYAGEISCQLYDSNSLAVSEEFQANLLSDCRYPDVAMDNNGNFAVVWMQKGSGNSILARLYSADGKAKTEPFEVSTIKFSSITRPSIAMARTGHFIVAWDGDPNLAGLDDIHGRRYDFNGTAIGEQFVVNTTIAGPQQNPEVAMNSRRQFIIVWDSKIDPNINERDIFAQRYDRVGRPIGGEFQVNTYMADDQKRPAVAIGENRKFVMAWQSDGQDGSGYGVFGQIGNIVGSADFNGDGFINFRDYCILADEWLKSEEPLRTDLIDDNKINEQDLAEFCYQWLLLME